MNKTTIYITGSPGFKSAIMVNLGREWIHDTQDFGKDLVSFELPENVTSGGFKRLIGERTISDHNMILFYELYDSSQSIRQTINYSVKRLITGFGKFRIGRKKEYIVQHGSGD